MKEKIFKAIEGERVYQDMQWGMPNHSPERWTTILTEKVGEVAKAVLKNNSLDYIDEMVQVAALAIAALDCCDRNGNSV